MSASDVQARASASSGRSDHQTVLHPRGCSAAPLGWVLLCHRCGRTGPRRPLIEHSHRGGSSANSQPLSGDLLFLRGTFSSYLLLLGRLLRSQLLGLGLLLGPLLGRLLTRQLNLTGLCLGEGLQLGLLLGLRLPLRFGDSRLLSSPLLG
jgi:hypothetical protein